MDINNVETFPEHVQCKMKLRDTTINETLKIEYRYRQANGSRVNSQ